MGDSADTLYRRYAQRLRAYFRKLGLRPDYVEDALQETFARLLTALAQKRIRSESIGGWLFQTARNVFVDSLRERERASRRRADAPGRCAEGPASEEAEAQETCRIILTAIQELPDGLRIPILLRHEQKLSYREIGERLRITENAAGIRNHRARVLLKARLTELGLTDF